MVGDLWLVAVGSRWRLAIGHRWQLAVGGWWRLAVGGGWWSLGRSLRAVLREKKHRVSEGPPRQPLFLFHPRTVPCPNSNERLVHRPVTPQRALHGRAPER